MTIEIVLVLGYQVMEKRREICHWLDHVNYMTIVVYMAILY
jgi:hypothetical protein